MKKINWTEDEIVNLPSGEHDFFERKSGQLLTAKSDTDFRGGLAKALSAFANSGGGHIILGCKDDGQFDGVPKIKKGRTSTRDWLEYIIPDSVSYPLRDFRVHEVNPANFPPDQVVIVIDVGASNLAPHQSIFDKVYYHRPGGRSVPAPHQYVQMLSRRDVYPGPTIAQAWMESVITPLLIALRRERVYLNVGRWSLAIYGKSLEDLRTFRTFGHDTLSLNLEQILEDHPNIIPLITGHDLVSNQLTKRIEELFTTLKDSPLLIEMYGELTSADSIAHLKKEFSQRISPVVSDKDWLDSAFGHSTDDALRRAFLAQEIVNKSPDLSTSMGYHPIWNTYKDRLLGLLDHPSFQPLLARLEQARSNLLQAAEDLESGLKDLRRDLATRFRIPYASN